jgi:ubiquinone/menaquinone biosynthesis C-methylase UbiE/RimJ/RimL family protein N-acetyltransferase
MTDFNARAKDWDSDPMKVDRAQTVANAIRATLPLQPGMTALEIGCGTGLLSFFLQSDFAQITLADTSDGMLAVLAAKIAESGVSNLHPLKLDLTTDPLPAARFDATYSLMTLHHIPDTEAILRQFAALLNPGGWLAIADLDAEDGSFHTDGTTDVHLGFERRQLQQQVLAAGFEQVKFTTAYVIQKSGREYPVFLLTAQKKVEISIRPASLAEYLQAHPENYSADALKFDSPDRPMPDLEAEKSWWRGHVETGKHLVYAILDSGTMLVGFVHAFSFKNGECETGINIFPRRNWQKGIGVTATRLFLQVLREKYGIRRVRAETNQENRAALALYQKLGFRETDSYAEDEITWKVLQVELGPGAG